MNTTQMQINQEEIDIKEIFRTIARYWKSIFFLTFLIMVITAVFTYFQPNIYMASSTVEVGVQKGGLGSQEDLLSMAMDEGVSSTDTEVEIIKSRFLAEMVAKEVNFTHKYYTTRRYKEVELYKESPFEVAMNRGFGTTFYLIPINEKSYRLVLEEVKDSSGNVIETATGEPWSYNEVCLYGEEVKSEYFHLNIIKVKETKDERYYFRVISSDKIGEYIQARVSVLKASNKADVLTLSVQDNVALRAQEAVNTLADAYIAQSIDKKNKEATRRLEFVDKQLKEITENLRGSAIKLEEFKRSSNTVDLSVKAGNIIQKISERDTSLEEIRITEEILKNLYEQVKSGKGLESLTIAGAQLQSKELSGMIQKLQEAMVQKKTLRENYTELHTEVRKLSKITEQYKSVILSTTENLISNIQERKKQLEDSIAADQKLLNTLPADERMFGQLQRKFLVNEKIYSYLLEKRSETAIVKASTVSKNRVIDTALLPKHPIKPKRKFIVLVGFILGLVLGIALAFIRNFMDDSIKSEEDITKMVDVPLLGLIPHMKQVEEKGQVFKSPKSAIAEAFRNLRINLQFLTPKKGTRIIVVTSTVGAEGKTTTSINLGGIMSMADKKTIILNLDMRKPTLHQRFGLQNIKGMSNLLAGNDTSLSEVIQQTEYDNLDILASGPIPPNPSELIQTEAMEKILERLKEVYHVIILDTPPIGIVTDARTLMDFADASIYILRAGHSKKNFLRSVQKLKKEEVKGLGVLINDVKMSKHGYGDKYGYGYGYGYYEEDGK